MQTTTERQGWDLAHKAVPTQRECERREFAQLHWPQNAGVCVQGTVPSRILFCVLVAFRTTITSVVFVREVVKLYD